MRNILFLCLIVIFLMIQFSFAGDNKSKIYGKGISLNTITKINSMPKKEKINKEPCPMCHQKTLELNEHQTEVPYFGKVFLFCLIGKGEIFHVSLAFSSKGVLEVFLSHFFHSISPSLYFYHFFDRSSCLSADVKRNFDFISHIL